MPSFANYLEKLEAVHETRFFHNIATVAKVLGNKLHKSERSLLGNIGGHLEAVHPVICTNPVTSWKSVFVNTNFMKHIVSITKDKSNTILKHLFSLFMLNHDLQVWFKWEKMHLVMARWSGQELILLQNSVTIWDNRRHVLSTAQHFVRSCALRSSNLTSISSIPT